MESRRNALATASVQVCFPDDDGGSVGSEDDSVSGEDLLSKCLRLISRQDDDDDGGEFQDIEDIFQEDQGQEETITLNRATTPNDLGASFVLPPTAVCPQVLLGHPGQAIHLVAVPHQQPQILQLHASHNPQASVAQLQPPAATLLPGSSTSAADHRGDKLPLPSKHVSADHAEEDEEEGGGGDPSPHCEICGKEFKNGKNLALHHQEIHEGRRGQFTCGDCGEVYTRLRSLERHQNKHHLGERPQCRICRKFVVNFDLHYRKFHCKSKCIQVGPPRKRRTTTKRKRDGDDDEEEEDDRKKT